MFSLLKLILNFFSREPKLPLILKFGPSPDTEKLFLRLSERDEELLSNPKNMIFLAVSLSKLPELALSNVIL